jgi:hypothetical protein
VLLEFVASLGVAERARIETGRALLTSGEVERTGLGARAVVGVCGLSVARTTFAAPPIWLPPVRGKIAFGGAVGVVEGEPANPPRGEAPLDGGTATLARTGCVGVHADALGELLDVPSSTLARIGRGEGKTGDAGFLLRSFVELRTLRRGASGGRDTAGTGMSVGRAGFFWLLHSLEMRL